MAEHETEEDEQVEGDPEQEAILRQAGVNLIWGSIQTGSLRPAIASLLLATAQPEPSTVTLAIRSEGGDLFETTALLDVMADVRRQVPVQTLGLGLCASGGSMILAAGTPGFRCIGQNAVVMVHMYSAGAQGTHAELVAHRRVQDISHRLMVDFWRQHSRHRTAKEVEKYLLTGQDVWMTAKEAVQHGIVDRVVGVARRPRAPARRRRKSV